MARDVDMRMQVEAAFRSLPLRLAFRGSTMRAPAATLWLRAVNDVVMLGAISPAGLAATGRNLPSDNAFRATGRKEARAELDRLARAAEKMIDAVNDLRAPAIKALADQHLMRDQVVALARSVATAAQQADVSEVPEKVGRGEQSDVRHPRLLARRLQHHFATLTGQRPTVPSKDGKDYGPFLDLVRTVFTSFEIAASPESQARAAIRFKEKKVS